MNENDDKNLIFGSEEQSNNLNKGGYNSNDLNGSNKNIKEKNQEDAHKKSVNDEEEQESEFGCNGFSWNVRMQRPESITREIIVPGKHSKFSLSPLETGFGLTIGNALRRILLLHIDGMAIAAIEVASATYKFQPICGVREDYCEIILNLKNIAFRNDTTETCVMATIDFNGPGEVYARDIVVPQGVTVTTPDVFICYVDADSSFNAKLMLCHGRGYLQADQQNFNDLNTHFVNFLKNAIVIDSLYNPVKKVSYLVKSARIKDKTDYDTLILEIITSGAFTPEECLAKAYRLLLLEMKCFEELHLRKLSVEEEDVNKKKYNIPDIMFLKINKLKLSTRSLNSLRRNNIKYVGDLVTKSMEDLLKSQQVGKRCLEEIQTILKDFNLSLDMPLVGWRPANVDEIAISIEKEGLI